MRSGHSSDLAKIFTENSDRYDIEKRSQQHKEIRQQAREVANEICNRIRKAIFDYLKVNSMEEAEKLSLLDSTLTYDVVTDELGKIEKEFAD